jgi:hypothetical protein
VPLAGSAASAKACRPATSRRTRSVRGSRRIRYLEQRGPVRSRLGASRPRRLGTISRRSLGLDRALGMDVGGRPAVGVCAVPLRPLGKHARRVGLVSGARVERAIYAPALVAFIGSPTGPDLLSAIRSRGSPSALANRTCRRTRSARTTCGPST